jgi:hypothetical protein
MPKNWEQIGEDQWKLTITPEQGGAASIYYGSKDAILDKLADSQANANRRISELRGSANGNGHGAAPPVEPKPLTANDRMQVVADLSNPATVDKAVGRVMESVIGPLDQFQQDRDAERAERVLRAQVEAAQLFAETTPEWYQSDHNCETLANFIVSRGGDLANVDHYRQGFATLSKAQLLQPKPDESQSSTEPPTEPQERNAPTLRAQRATTGYSTGVRSSDISGTPPIPVKRLKFSREQIANMSAETYRRNMSDPEFQRAVEVYTQGKTPRRAQVAI